MLLLLILTSIDERRRIEAEEDAKNARAEGLFFLWFFRYIERSLISFSIWLAMTAKERLGQIHGLSADKI